MFFCIFVCFVVTRRFVSFTIFVSFIRFFVLLYVLNVFFEYCFVIICVL